MGKQCDKQWRTMTTAERLRAFACFMDSVVAALLLQAADELDEMAKEVQHDVRTP